MKFKVLKYTYITLVGLILILAIVTASDQISDLHISTVYIWPLCVAILFAFLNIFFSIKRFQSLLPGRTSFTQAARPHLAGFLANYGALVPGLGSGVKYGLLRAQNTSTKNAAKVLGVEIVLDLLLCLLISLALAPIFFGQYFWELINQYTLHFDNSLILVVLFLTVLVFIFVLKSHFISVLVSSIRSVFNKEGLIISAFFTLLMWLCFAGTLEFLSKSFHQVSESIYSAALLTVSSSYLAGLLSLIPSGLGVRELSGAYIIANTSNSYSVGDAVLVMVVLRVFTVIAGAVVLTIITLATVKTTPNNK